MSELTDLEICKKMAGIECIDFRVQNDKVLPEAPAETNIAKMTDVYNPLTDDALCFKLMVKYDVLREGTGTIYFRAVIANHGNYEYYRATAETLNKAICLAIIEANQ